MCISSPLFKEGLSVDVVLAHGGGLPREVRSRGVALEEVRPANLVCKFEPNFLPVLLYCPAPIPRVVMNQNAMVW